MQNETIVMVKTRYLPRSGTTSFRQKKKNNNKVRKKKKKKRKEELNMIFVLPSDVGGMMSKSSKKKRVKASRMEMHRVIFSPEFDESMNTGTVRKDMLTQGTIKLTI